MAVDGESKRLLVLEADERDVLRAQAAIDRAEAATAKKRDQALVAHLKGQGAVTKETLATARAAQALIDKEKEAAKAADLIGLSVDTNAKKMGGLTRGAVEFDRKLGDIGKTLGGMAVGFGIQAGLSIVGELLKPPSREDMDAFIAGLQDASGALGIAANHARMLRGHLDAQAKQDAALDKKFGAVDDVVAQFSASARQKQMIEEMRIADLAYERTKHGKDGLTAEEHSKAISTIAAKYKDAAASAREFGAAARSAVGGRGRKKEAAGFGGFLAPWEGQADLAADQASVAGQEADAEARRMAQIDATINADRASRQQTLGYAGENNTKLTEEQAARNLKLAESYDKIGDALGFVADAAAESGGSMLKFEKLLLGGLMGAGRTYAKSQVKVELAKAAAANAKVPGSGSGHLYAAAAWTVAAGVLGLGASSLGSSGGGGGGGGGGLSSGDRYGGPQDLRGGAGGEQVHHHIYSSGGFTQRELLQHSRRMRALTTDTNAED